MIIETQKLYLISNVMGHYKIGIAKDVEARLRILQTGNSTKLNILRIYTVDYPREREQRVHDMFAEKRLLGEWFDSSTNIDCLHRYIISECKGILETDNTQC